MNISKGIAVVTAGFALSGTLHAQGLYVGLRGGGAFPTGDFSQTTTGSTTAGSTVLNAAKSGFGYGADAGIQLGVAGIYAGFDHINFDCNSNNCNSDGKYKLQGVTAGIKLLATGAGIARPWVKGGVTVNELEGGYGSGQSTQLTTDRKPGYEVGVGLDIGILGLVNLTPQARYIGQNFKYGVPGVNTSNATPTQGVNYFTFDLGLSLHDPLEGVRH